MRRGLHPMTPAIQQAFLDNELLTSVELNVFGPDAKGAETLTYTVKLTNASIAGIRLLPGPNDQVVQEVSLTYQKIEWIWRDGNVTASDDWEKHNVKR